ncbi:hypothetical protein FSP39_024967 [Pinctada imbricata]|uniref:Uncharacterized protein n=1 Tax=Pinctada imbricata TaxID=66713 RepID=A0AA88Y7Z3_PINIB|nr:hypothetical protein FSP39_024967 [Pinctada imbricata]
MPRHKNRIVSRGSSFRYSGRTQKQLMSFVRENPSAAPQFQRSVSGRISAASRSTSVTPKIPAKVVLQNSAAMDAHQSMASSDSHVISTDALVTPPIQDHGETRSVDSSHSGSHSLHSPKFDRQRSYEGSPGIDISLDSRDVDEHPPVEVDEDRDEMPPLYQPPPLPMAVIDRKLSAPVLGSKEYSMSAKITEDHHLERCDEVENIPETVLDEPVTEDFPPPITRSASDMQEVSPQRSPLMYEREEEEFPPPPSPPPPFEESDLQMTPTSHNKSNSLSGHLSPHQWEEPGMRSNISVLSSSKTEESEDDPKKKSKRHLVDRAYYIAKELLMTERTYKKDLEVVTVWFQNSLNFEEGYPDYITNLFAYFCPIYDFHCQFLKEIDQRLSMWEGKTNAHQNGDYQRIGDIMVSTFPAVLPLYRNYLEKQEELMADLDQALHKNKRFEQMYRDFEKQRVCYLPLNTFLLKPAHRLLHYKLIMERLTKHYSTDHPDFADCKGAFTKITDVVTEFRESMRRQENIMKLTELQRDMVGIDCIINRDRTFLREGCLQKFSRKGYQQRMFFLFSDLLVYTSRVASSMLQFKVHGQLPLRGMIVEESDHAKMAVANSFAIYGGNKCILVAASSQEEKDKWIEDLNEAIIRAKNRTDDKYRYPSLKSSTSSSDNVDNAGEGEINGVSQDKNIQHRANTTTHVCWHRNTSVSMRDHERAIKNQLSGYLLRKFKNSNGWQKLWVVFTNFCLFFFKTYQDDFPLASLPLLGYAVNTPEDEDGIHKDHVFKLQFKNHVYFFRAESEYTFERWMEVINSATHSSHRLRLFSRMDSNQPNSQ